MKLSSDMVSRLAGIPPASAEILERLNQYSALVQHENSLINLVSRAGDVETEIDDQIAISIAAHPLVPRDRPLHWLDLGSGGGFPAIPLAILRPSDSFILIESVAKKAFFLERSVERLELLNIRIVNQRAEDFLDEVFKTELPWNVISIKAVTGWDETFAWARQSLPSGGMLLTFKALGDAPETFDGERDFELITDQSINDVMPRITARILIYQKK